MLRYAADAISQPLFLIDRSHRIVLANNAAQKLTAIDETNLLGRRIETFLSFEDSQTHLTIPTLQLSSIETLILLAKTHDLLHSVTFLPLHHIPYFTDFKPRPTALVILTPQTSAQAQDQTTAIHLNFLGQLTMRIAHDMSNSLTSIIGNAELIQEELTTLLTPPVPEPLTALLETVLPEIKDVVRKSRELADFIGTLKDYARQQPTTGRSVDLNTAIAETITLARSLLGRRIQIQFLKAEDLPEIYMDRLRIDQILLSILVHSNNAMPTGGRVTIETEEAFLNAAFVANHPGAREGRYTKLSLTDSSPGIDHETLKHIFDLPKSGKAPDPANLGLPTVYSILKQFRGYINVETWIGKGTRFDIYFPQTPLESVAIDRSPLEHEEILFLHLQPPPSISSLQRTPPNGSLILVAEDDLDIQKHLQRNLSKAGYKTIITSDGNRALDLYRTLSNEGKQPALLIADLGLPAMDGRSLSNTVRHEYPNAAVLLTSGYRIDLDPATRKTEEGFDFLQKPFAPYILLSTIEKILSKAIP